jgi:Ser/Thr protein kinase RdoA (MazF antagonist)
MTDLFPVINQFQTSGKIIEINPIGSGHIHETYWVKSASADTDDYVLQKINTHVFRDPQAVMHNIGLVSAHLHEKILSSGKTDTRHNVLTPLKLRNGRLMFVDAHNNTWRCFIYIKGHKSFDRAINTELVYEGGKAYGNFLLMLSDLSTSNIKETIHRFHDLDLRIDQFETACANGLKERINEVRHEIEMLRSRSKHMRTILMLGKQGKIPLRIVHHDTKINNILFDEHGKGLCVIDLDTVMPGYVHDDFGDSIRTFTNTGEEDDHVLDRVSMNITYFEAYAKGFLEVTNAMLSPVEKKHLALSARVMTYMQTLRFLADYLNGDTYYRIHHPKHNLQRARAQMKLLVSMEEQFEEMKRIVEYLS